MFSDSKMNKGGITQKNIKKAMQAISNEQPKKTILTQKEKKGVFVQNSKKKLNVEINKIRNNHKII